MKIENNIKQEFLDELKNKMSTIEDTDIDLFENINNATLQLSRDLDALISFKKNRNKSLIDISKFDNLKKLQIGGGTRHLKYYINLDIFQPADIVWDVRSGIPFQDERFEEVFCEHFFEHLDFPKSALFFLSEVCRVLKRGGIFKIVVPDCGRSLKEYYRKGNNYFNKIKEICYSKRILTMEINSKIDVINYLFRDQFDNPKYTVHWWAYDKENLSKMLTKSGFNLIKKWKFDHATCNHERRYYSLYLIAKK